MSPPPTTSRIRVRRQSPLPPDGWPNSATAGSIRLNWWSGSKNPSPAIPPPGSPRQEGGGRAQEVHPDQPLQCPAPVAPRHPPPTRRCRRRRLRLARRHHRRRGPPRPPRSQPALIDALFSVDYSVCPPHSANSGGQTGSRRPRSSSVRGALQIHRHLAAGLQPAVRLATTRRNVTIPREFHRRGIG